MFNQLFFGLFLHSFKWIKSSSQFTLKNTTSLYDFIHDFKSLLFANTHPQGASITISTNSDSRRKGHGCLFFCEFGRFELASFHSCEVIFCGFETVVFFNDGVEEFVKFYVGVSGSGVYTGPRIQIFDARIYTIAK